jgi:signal transduction histidine kinase
MSNPGNSITILFLIGTAAMLIMAVVIILFVVFYQKKVLGEQVKQQALEVKYQQQMLMAQMESQEDERRRVAKDLHDDVGLMLQALRTTTLAILQNAPEEDRREVQQMVTEVTETVRRICWDLMPSSLEYFGLTEAVDEMCTRLSSRSQRMVTFSFHGEVSPIEKDKQTLLYRMVQELVGNALKHANATAIEVVFTWTKNQLQINVTDNGIGFDINTVKNRRQPGHGLGLLSLENRSRLLPATLIFENNFPRGTNASVTYTFQYAQN